MPSNIGIVTFTATKYTFDIWGDGGTYPRWAEADYLDENGTLITAEIKNPPQGTNIPLTLDFDIKFDQQPTAKSALLKMWVYSSICEKTTQYNITVTRT